jgi:hypothetical protein
MIDRKRNEKNCHIIIYFLLYTPSREKAHAQNIDNFSRKRLCLSFLDEVSVIKTNKVYTITALIIFHDN